MKEKPRYLLPKMTTLISTKLIQGENIPLLKNDKHYAKYIEETKNSMYV
jgi:hypothetical protein